MRADFLEKLKENKAKKSNVTALDASYKEVTQMLPMNSIDKFEFIWENTDTVISSIFNFPAILLSLGKDSGNISKDALIRSARSTFLTPLKNETANSLSKIVKMIFDDDDLYLRFKDYEQEIL